MPKVYAATNGCEEGQLKSDHVQNFFLENGFTCTKNLTEADYIVFFPCGLTDPKEKQSISIIQKLQVEKKNTAKLIVWGCLPKINPELLAKVYEGPIVGPKDTGYFERVLGKIDVPFDEVHANALVPNETFGVAQPSRELAYSPINYILWRLRNIVDQLRLPPQKWLFDESSFFIRVAEGCTGSCTYCSERPAWGRVKSRSIERIVTEFQCGLQKGFKRFFLVAADLGSYGSDIGCNAIDLLNEFIRVGEGNEYKLIINQMNPADLRKMLPGLEGIFASGKIEALGCQVESGSNRIIELMGRKYTAEDWRECMLRINSKFPSVRLSTHIMIGFPTEADQDFEATMKLLDFPLSIDWLGIFAFSPRPTVYASRLPEQVPEKTKEQRYWKLYRRYTILYMLNVAIRNIRYIKSRF